MPCFCHKMSSELHTPLAGTCQDIMSSFKEKAKLEQIKYLYA